MFMLKSQRKKKNNKLVKFSLLKKSVHEVYGLDPDPIFQGWFRIRIHMKKKMDHKPLINDFQSCSDLGHFYAIPVFWKTVWRRIIIFMMRLIFYWFLKDYYENCYILFYSIFLFLFRKSSCWILEYPVLEA